MQRSQPNTSEKHHDSNKVKKKKAIEAVQSATSLQGVSKRIGISPQTLRKWATI